MDKWIAPAAVAAALVNVGCAAGPTAVSPGAAAAASPERTEARFELLGKPNACAKTKPVAPRGPRK